MIITRGFGDSSLLITRGFGTVGPVVEAIIKIIPDFIVRRASIVNTASRASLSKFVRRVPIVRIVRREDD
jgi:hypothetical protein